MSSFDYAVRDFLGLARLATGLKDFGRRTISVRAAENEILTGIRRRDRRFLAMLDASVFANSSSPYLRLMRCAGCERGDVHALVAKEGADAAAETLAAAGVYVDWQEFKGGIQAKRGSETFTFRPRDFDNPLIRGHYSSSTGGTRGRPTRTRIDLDYLSQSAPHWATWFAAHDWLDRPLVFWTPATAGIANRLLLCARFGKKPDAWFSSCEPSHWRERISAMAVHHLVGRAVNVPARVSAPAEAAGIVAKALHDQTRGGAPPCVVTSPSLALRAVENASDRGLDLRGVDFLLCGEALTAERRVAIESLGSRAVPTYGFSEGGNVGSQCPCNEATDEIHVSLDAWIVDPPPVAGEQFPKTLRLTSLRPASPKILLNTEIGDTANIVRRPCDCLFGRLGYDVCLHTIRSNQKISTLGTTIMVADLFPLIDRV